MTRDEFCAAWEEKLQTILFSGFFNKDQSEAGMYRKMCVKGEQIKGILGLMYDALVPPGPLPVKPLPQAPLAGTSQANGQVAQTAPPKQDGAASAIPRMPPRRTE